MNDLNIFFIVSLCFLSGCSQAIEQNKINAYFDNSSNLKYQLPRSGVENILFIDTRFDLNPALFSCYNYIMNRVEVYNAETTDFLYHIQFEEFGPNAIRPSKYHLFQNYLVIIDDLKNFAIVNNQGEILDKFNGREIKINREPNSFLYRLQASPTFGMSKQIDYERNKLFAHISRWDVSILSDEFYTENKNTILEIDLQSLEYSPLKIPYPPEILKYKPIINENLTRGYPLITFSRQKIIYNYPFNNRIYIYDLINQKNSSIEAKSAYTEQEVPEVSKSMDKRQISEWDVNQLRFNQVIYDPFRNLYLRTHSYFNKTLKKRIYFLMIFDEKFNTLEELRLPDECHTNYYPAPNGIMFHFRHPTDENNIHFKKLVIE